jgi:hypothetical protein
MGLRSVLGDVALPLAGRAAGTYTSGPIAVSGAASDVVLLIYASTTSGTPTLNASLEESSDGTTWTAVAGSSIAQLSAAGNALANAQVAKVLVRVTATVAGTSPNVTFRAAVAVFS